MTWLLLFLVLLLLSYGFVVMWLAYGFLKIPTFELRDSEDQTAVSIIICARNEEKNIVLCLQSILNQSYDPKKIQIILVDDASTDATAAKAESILRHSDISYRKLFNKQQEGKKQSITNAVQHAMHPLIITRDADTFTISKKWLTNISAFYKQMGSDLIIGPVSIANYGGLLWALQAIENNVLSVFSAGSSFYKNPFLCSGANLIFTKAIFEKTKGYTSHKHIASGDDILFMEDVKKINGSKIHFLKSQDSLVFTYPCLRFKELMSQKIRWASKFKSNPNAFNFSFATLSFLVNLAWLYCFISLSFVSYKLPFQLFVFLKLCIDILLLFLASGFIKNKTLLWYSLPVAFIYPVYATFVGITSLFVKPQWK